MSERPLVSVCVPTRDRPTLLCETLASVVAQTERDLEVLVTDNGAKQDAARVVEELRDPRVRYHPNGRDLGMAGNWDRGVKLARGEFVAILHDDDTWAPTFLARAVGALRAHPSASLVVTGATLCDPSMRPLRKAPEPARDAFLTGPARLDPFVPVNKVYCPGILVRSSAYRSAGGLYRHDLKHAPDWEMWLRLALRGDVVTIAEPLANYRTGHGSLTDQHAADARGNLFMEREAARTLEIALEDARRLGDRHAVRALGRALAEKRLSVAMWEARAGDRRAWARMAAATLARAPAVALREPRLVARALLPRYRWPS